MTAPAAQLAELLAGIRFLLLDFDGPICAIFGGHPTRTVVLELLNLISPTDARIPEHVRNARDPFEVLRYAATVDRDLAKRVEHELRTAEIEAIATATPTPHTPDVITTWRRAGRAVAVVSNNSSDAVAAYLALRELDVDLIVARTSPDPALLKPSPYLVTNAIRELHAQPPACALVGDSVSDIAAARSAGVTSVGYANKPGKHQALSDAGADLVIGEMQALADAAAIATP